jgi:RNA polymerase sporulation-specific sigma factor
MRIGAGACTIKANPGRAMAASWTKAHIEQEPREDAELLRAVRDGDDRALDVLLDRYRSFARSKSRSYFLAGADREDVVQEGMIGLYKAIRDFDTGQNTPFRAFAELCISRQILTAIKTANRQKHGPLNSSISLDAPVHTDTGQQSVADVVVLEQLADPADVVISTEEVKDLSATMRANLTELEADVLRLYMDGRSYEEIAGALGNHVKSIDNALQRIKRKLQRHIDQRDRHREAK